MTTDDTLLSPRLQTLRQELGYFVVAAKYDLPTHLLGIAQLRKRNATFGGIAPA